MVMMSMVMEQGCMSAAQQAYSTLYLYIYIYGSVSIFQAPGWIARPSKKPNKNLVRPSLVLSKASSRLLVSTPGLFQA